MVDISENSISATFKNLFAGMYSVIDISFDISGSISAPGKIFIDISKNNNKEIFIDNSNNDFSANVIVKKNFGTDNSFTSVSWNKNSQRLTFDVSANYINETITIPKFQFKVLGDISMNSSISTTSQIELSFNGTSVGPKSLKDLTVKHPIKDVSLVFNPKPHVNDNSLSFDLDVTLDPSFNLSNNNTFKIDFHANDLSNNTGGAYPIMPNSNVFSSNNIVLTPNNAGFNFSSDDMSWNDQNKKELMFKTSNAQTDQSNNFTLTFKDISGPNNYISDMNPKIQIIEKKTDPVLVSNETVYKPIQHVPIKKIQYDPNHALSNLTTSFDNSFVGISNRITVDFSLNAELKSMDKLQIQFFDSSNGNHPSRIFTDKSNNILIGGDASLNFNNAKINNGVITITVSNDEYNVKSATGYPNYESKKNISLTFDVSNNSDTQYDLCGQKLIFDPSNVISSVEDSSNASANKNDTKITLFKPYFRIDISKTSIQVVPDTTTEKIMLDISTNIVLGANNELLFNINEDASNSDLLDSSFIKDISYVNLEGGDISDNYSKDQNPHKLILSNTALQPTHFSSNPDISLAYIVSDLCSNKLSSVANFKWPSVDISVNLDWSYNQFYTKLFDNELKSKMNEFIKENSTMNQQQQQSSQQQPSQQQLNTIKISMKGNTLSDNGQTIINTSKKTEHNSINKIHELLKNQLVDKNESKKINEILQKTTISESDITGLSNELPTIFQSISGELTNIQKQKEKTNKDRILYSNTSGSDITDNNITSNINSQFMQSLNNTSGISFEKLAASNLDLHQTIKTNIENKIAGNFEFEFKSDISGYQNSAGVFSLSGDIEKLFSNLSEKEDKIKESNKLIEARIKKMRDTGGNNFKYVVNSIDQAPIDIASNFKQFESKDGNKEPTQFQIFDSSSTAVDICANDFFRNNMKKVKTDETGEFIIPMIALEKKDDKITIDFSNSNMLIPRQATLTIEYKLESPKTINFEINGTIVEQTKFSTDGSKNTSSNPILIQNYDLTDNESIEIFGYKMKVQETDSSMVYIVNDKAGSRFELEENLTKYGFSAGKLKETELSLNEIQIKTHNASATIDSDNYEKITKMINDGGKINENKRSMVLLELLENRPGLKENERLILEGSRVGIKGVDNSGKATDVSLSIPKTSIDNFNKEAYWKDISNILRDNSSSSLYIPTKFSDDPINIYIIDDSGTIHETGIQYQKKYVSDFGNSDIEHRLINAAKDSLPHKVESIEITFESDVSYSISETETKTTTQFKILRSDIKEYEQAPDRYNRIQKGNNDIIIIKNSNNYVSVKFGKFFLAINDERTVQTKNYYLGQGKKIISYRLILTNGIYVSLDFGSTTVHGTGGTDTTIDTTTETPRIFMSTPLSEKYYSVKNRHYKMQFTSRAFNSATQLYKTSNNMIINQQLSTKGSSNRLRKLKAKAIAQNKYSKQ